MRVSAGSLCFCSFFALQTRHVRAVADMLGDKVLDRAKMDRLVMGLDAAVRSGKCFAALNGPVKPSVLNGAVDLIRKKADFPIRPGHQTNPFPSVMMQAIVDLDIEEGEEASLPAWKHMYLQCMEQTIVVIQVLGSDSDTETGLLYIVVSRSGKLFCVFTCCSVVCGFPLRFLNL